jgi:hypothetical protein
MDHTVIPPSGLGDPGLNMEAPIPTPKAVNIISIPRAIKTPAQIAPHEMRLIVSLMGTTGITTASSRAILSAIKKPPLTGLHSEFRWERNYGYRTHGKATQAWTGLFNR